MHLHLNWFGSKLLFVSLVATFVSFLLYGCENSNHSPGSGSLASTTTLTSTSLNAASPQGQEKDALGDCSEGADPDYCLAPDNVTGMVWYMGVMIGSEGGFNLGPIVGNVTMPKDLVQFKQDELLAFNFLDDSPLAGNPQCCNGEPPYPSDDQALAARIEAYFAYTDATFTLNPQHGSPPEVLGIHTIRLVYGDVLDSTGAVKYKKGDLLYSSDATTFKWCTNDGCDQTTRPQTPLQLASIASWELPQGGHGSQTVPIFAANIINDPPIKLTQTQAENNSLHFTVDFMMGEGVGFVLESGQTNLASLNTVVKLVKSYRLPSDPGGSSSGSGGAGLKVNLDIDKVPLPEGETTEPGE